MLLRGLVFLRGRPPDVHTKLLRESGEGCLCHLARFLREPGLRHGLKRSHDSWIALEDSVRRFECRQLREAFGMHCLVELAELDGQVVSQLGQSQTRDQVWDEPFVGH